MLREDFDELVEYFKKAVDHIRLANTKIILSGDRSHILETVKNCPLVFHDRTYDLVLTGKRLCFSIKRTLIINASLIRSSQKRLTTALSQKHIVIVDDSRIIVSTADVELIRDIIRRNGFSETVEGGEFVLREEETNIADRLASVSLS